MANTVNETYPSYFPFHQILYLKYRKRQRHSLNRRLEQQARNNGPSGFVPDGDGNWAAEVGGDILNPTTHINRSALWMDEDLNLPEIKAVIEKMDAVKKKLNDKGLTWTATAASLSSRSLAGYSEKMNSWENAWSFQHADVKPGHKVLDIGGASTGFDFFLADYGCIVCSVDDDPEDLGVVYNMNYVGRKMGWDCRALNGDSGKPLPFADNTFDRIFSIGLIQHLTSPDRQRLMQELGRVLKPGGIAAFSADYDNERDVLVYDKGLRFGYREKFNTDVLDPSGMRFFGNNILVDAYPLQNFLGVFFFIKD